MHDLRGVRTASALLAPMLLMLAALGGCASTCTDPRCAQDADLTARVKTAVFADTAMRPPNMIYVKTRNGVVYLSGMVATDLQLEAAESYARSVPGVASVVNNIAVTNNTL